MELESLEKLRDENYIPGYRGNKTLEMIADAVQAEVDERYMPLPLDADGVPIRLGTIVSTSTEKNARITALRHIGDEVWPGGGKGTKTIPPYECHVIAMRTVEDVTNDLANEVICILSSEDDLHISHEQNIAIYEASAKYAAKLQMREGGAE